MKKILIKKILHEVMISKLNEWEQNTQQFGNVFSTLISIDEENIEYNRLFLFVGFNDYGPYQEYSYSFMVVDQNGKPATEYLTNRSDVSKFLPQDITNKKEIFPIVIDLTKRLLTHYKPSKIIRRTSENLVGNSLIRYELITNILINDYMYKLTKQGKGTDGKDFWIMELVNNDQIHENTDNDDVMYLDVPSIEESKKIWEDKLNKILPFLTQAK